MINVTKTFLPPQEEYQDILSRAWDMGWITNRGILVKELEQRLQKFLGVSNILATTNGTLPLQITIKVLGLKGEIITTPFSYVATTSSIVWEGCHPVFVDIRPDTLNIDESKIEESITDKTSAILATHVFGNPCNVEEIERIAKKYDLKVIYDAAHCFGVKYKGKSIFEYGDISTCSFHATKIFHTGEGGAIFTKNDELFRKLFSAHNFGHKGQEDFTSLGINAKMSELQAAMGLAVFPYFDEILDSRKKLIQRYNEMLDFTKIRTISLNEHTAWNFSYYPVIFENESNLLTVKRELEKAKIFSRRYFYPSLTKLPYLKRSSSPNGDNLSKRILCLPNYKNLSEEVIKRTSQIINLNQ